MSSQPPGALTSPSTTRNRGPILEVLKRCLPAAGLVLEVAAGAGEHSVFNGAALTGLSWQPTDADPRALASITAWRDRAGLANLLPPLRLDAANPDRWPLDRADAVVNINMIHIPRRGRLPRELITGSASSPCHRGAILFLYGPFLERDVVTAPSNLAFDRDLRARDPAWGLRRLEDIVALATRHGLVLAERVAMPANNLALVFRRT